jgi:hypothetical protein
MTDKDDAETLLQPYFNDLRACIESGWHRWAEFGRLASALRAPLGTRTRANFISDQITTCVRSTFSNRQGVRIVDRRGFPELVIRGRYVIRFKKLDHHGRSRNILTKAQREWFRQQLSLPDLPPAAQRLIAGYVLDELGTEISRVLVTAPVSAKEIEWKIELTDDGASKVVEMPRVARAPQPPTVRSAERRSAEGDTDETA